MTSGPCTSTREQRSQSGNELPLPTSSQQYDHSSTENMSEQGPSETPTVIQSHIERGLPTPNQLHGDAVLSETMLYTTQELSTAATAHTTRTTGVQTEQRPIDLKLHFEDFASQLRQRRHAEYRRRMLEHRKGHLQKAVALTGRLQRLSSWLHDGLVEMSKSHNASDFVRVHQHLLDLTSKCTGRWQYEIRSFDPLASVPRSTTDAPASFLSRISTTAKTDCLEFIQNVRSNPKFLVDRFKAVHPSQLVALSTAPRYSDPAAYLTTTLSPNRNRLSQRKKLTSYAKSLEEYANSFERKNAIAFLLHNCFGADSKAESQLRLETWSSICATLYMDMGPPFLSFFHQILWEFAGMGIWRARTRLELFLMDLLQRGAFLLEPVGDFKRGALDTYIADTLATDTAREFFDSAVKELFAILAEEDGGFPEGVLHLLRAMLSKLPDQQAQASVRGWILSEWFLDSFLRTAISFPENQKMLLQFYISDSARSTILTHLWRQACEAARNALESLDETTTDPMQRDVYSILCQLDGDLAERASFDRETTCSISVCATDLIHILEALSQQYTGAASHFEPFVHSLITAFNSQRDSPKLDRLRRELQLLVEPGLSSGTADLLQEEWLNIKVTGRGRLLTPESATESDFATLDAAYQYFEPLDPSERASVRLAIDQVSQVRHSVTNQNLPKERLRDQFLCRGRDARSAADMVDANFWYSAVDYIDAHYPLSNTLKSDGRILRRIFDRLHATPTCEVTFLENQIDILETNLSAQQTQLDETAKRLQHLKFKMWYTMDVVNSREYESARNVSKALNYMSMSAQLFPDASDNLSSKSSDRPGTSASAASSIFEQPQLDTMKILKASSEHGGPKKLSDEQIEKTKSWLSRNNVDNFCKGEERIHRFAMEIRILTRKLVAERANESPTLWYSELWAIERNLFEVAPQPAATFPGNSGPPSLMSESPSSMPWLKPAFGSQPSSRSLDSDHPRRIGYGSTRISQDVLGNELTSSFIAGGRSKPISATESIRSAFSSVPSQTRSTASTSAFSQPPSIWDVSSVYHSKSQTSASIISRPSSLFSEYTASKAIDTTVEKAQFLESLRESLTVLLLSDLGNPVWSSGSETDAWLNIHKRSSSISQRIEQRHLMSGLVPLGHKSQKSLPQTRQRRAFSAADHQRGSEFAPSLSAAVLGDERLHELDQVLCKISRQVDPNAKLRAVHEFHQLANIFLDQCSSSIEDSARVTARRRSLGSDIAVPRAITQSEGFVAHVRTDSEVVEWVKDILLALQPQTLFRDLQYIAAFASPAALNRATDGGSLVQVGLAALASKDEICRIMVELADRIVTRDGIKRRSSGTSDRDYSLSKARDYWIIGAREGNAVAQRELAGLYLAHPEMSMMPAVTAPLALSGEVFRNDMMWRQSTSKESGTDGDGAGSIQSEQRALCLALHWMQLAAQGGDRIASQRLQERKVNGLAVTATL